MIMGEMREWYINTSLQTLKTFCDEKQIQCLCNEYIDRSLHPNKKGKVLMAKNFRICIEKLTWKHNLC